MILEFTHDYSKVLQYVVYKNPADYPGKFVVRQWTVEAAKEKPLEAIAFDDLDAAREAVPEGLYRIPRFPQDDPTILEVWI